MAQFALFFASIFSIVTPFAAVPVYLGVTADVPVAVRRGIPRRTATAAATRFMGLILAAVAVELITGGLQRLFPAWAAS